MNLKLYCLKHPIKGYLSGNSNQKRFTDQLQKARKFNRRSDATNCKKTTYNPDISDFELIEIELEIKQITKK